MARIAFILLCHRDAEAVIRQAESLTSAGDYVALHFDARAGVAPYVRIREALADNPHVAFPDRRVKCGWGEWSLVQATLNTLQCALKSFPRATHCYMLSGDCMAIKSAEYIHTFLDAHDRDFIESVDYFESDWIRTGWKEERLIYRHWFNERTQRRMFYAMFEIQRRLGLIRRIPADLDMMIGSQWWCMRRRTVEAILDFLRGRPDVVRFFRTTWIPDETFFQTLVRHLVPQKEIESRTPTFLMFSDYGMPVTFYNDHYDLLLNQDYLFARKISPEAHDLKRRLGVLFSTRGVSFEVSNEGRALHRFLTQKGRTGERFAPRFWERESSLGRDRELLIVICKKWEVARRLVGRIRRHTDLPCIEYLFNDERCALPDLGGLERTMDKRHRHRRALLRMLFDFYESDRLLICIDPASLDLLEDFGHDRSVTRMLEVDCVHTETFLRGHARRVGLAGERTRPETLSRLLPALRNDLARESERIRDRGFAHLGLLSETDPPARNAAALAEFLTISETEALEIVTPVTLFADRGAP